MDASKLKNILADLDGEEDSQITEGLTNLVGYISSNQSNEISTEIKKINTQFENSVTNSYSPSNVKILNEIGALDYYGNSGKLKLNSILNENSFNLQKVITDLQAYVTKRTVYTTLIVSANGNLQSLNISNHYHDDDTFETGILMPSEYTNKKIVTITKELNRWDKVFKTLKELTGNSPEDTEINFVSNGSLQFFIDNSPQISACLALTIERVVKLYKNIVDIRIAKDKLKALGVSSGEQKIVEKQEKDFFNKEIDKISADIIKDFASKSIESGRLNEIKIAVKGHVTYIAKCIDNGLIIEIIPPEISEPAEVTVTETNKAEVKLEKEKYESTLKKIEIIQKSMDAFKTIGKTGVDIMKFLTDKEIDDDEEIDDEDSES